jgi:hypothetical protein
MIKVNSSAVCFEVGRSFNKKSKIKKDKKTKETNEKRT